MQQVLGWGNTAQPQVSKAFAYKEPEMAFSVLPNHMYIDWNLLFPFHPRANVPSSSVSPNSVFLMNTEFLILYFNALMGPEGIHKDTEGPSVILQVL